MYEEKLLHQKGYEALEKAAQGVESPSVDVFKSHVDGDMV